jgi:hypothetical protein
MISRNTDHWVETYRSLIQLSIEGFKFCALVNGGAAVALIAYLGNIAAKCDAVVPDMRCSMAAFLTGIAACGIALLFAYLTQLSLLNEFKGKKLFFKHNKFLWLAFIFYACSGVAFCIGSWESILRFSRVKKALL